MSPGAAAETLLSGRQQSALPTKCWTFPMSYDEIDIEDMEWKENLQAFTYQCPCGDLFQITMEELAAGEEIAHCPSCSLYITVIYDPVEFQQQAERQQGEQKPIAVSS